MTLLMERAEGAPPAATGDPRRRLLLTMLPWLAPAVAWIAGLLYTGTPAGYVALYLAYLAVVIVLPGTLVHRALRGSRGNLAEDLGMGLVTGLFVLIVGWALAAATRLQVLLPVWPLLIIALFLAVPGLRRHWRIPQDERRPLPVLWSWIVAAVALVVVAVSYPFWHAAPLPPATAYYYQDLMYHLALVHEMTRSIPFQVPQVAGDTLRYHYLSDADMAAASMITRIPAQVVLLRLWIVPIGVATVFVCASVARQLTGRWWAGALGGATAIFASPLALGSVPAAFGDSPLQFYSPSQVYAMPMLGLLLAFAVDVLRGRRLGWAWVIIFPLGLACAGAKSSALPPFVAGLVLAVVVLLVRQRDRLRSGLALLALTLAAMLAGMKVFAGGGAGTLAIQPFAILFWSPPYKRTLGAHDVVDGTRALPLGVEQASVGGLIFIFGIFAWWLVLQSPRLLGLVALTTRRTRGEPAAWLLGGMGVAGTGGAWLLWHPSASQLYFFLCAAPFAALLTVWLLADQTRTDQARTDQARTDQARTDQARTDQTRTDQARTDKTRTAEARTGRPVVAGLVVGALWAVLAPHGYTPRHNTVGEWAWAMAEPLLLTAAVAVVVALGVLLGWRAATGRYAWRAIPAGLVAAILGASLAGALMSGARATGSALFRHHPPANPEKVITADEMRAALWLGAHSGRDDVIATNVHCQPLTWKAACDARAFWVSGLAGRRAVMESWGYTDQAVTSDGVNGKRYVLQPAPYPERFDLNQRVFARGDPADVARLHSEYHVRWLLADSRALGGVSANLARVAEVRYQAGPVTVYELPG